MLSNPPYGKSWKSDLERMGGKDGIKDPRFMIEHAGDPEYSLITRSSDGQMLFLANMLSKMKHGTKLGSRIAEVHNGSLALHRRRRPGREQHPPLDHRERLARGHRRPAAQHVLQHRHRDLHLGAQQPQARAPRRARCSSSTPPQWFKPLRKNLGKKNCELSDEDIQRICDTFLAFEETEQSKIFPNAAFGYWKVTVERPLRLKGIDPDRAYTPEGDQGAQGERRARRDDAPPVIRKIHKTGTAAPTRCTACSRPPSTASAASSSTSPTPTCATPSRCRCWKRAASRPSCAARCCPTRPTPGIDPESVKTGYEISFTRYFYKPQPLRTLEEIRADILALEKETEGLLGEIIGGGA